MLSRMANAGQAWGVLSLLSALTCAGLSTPAAARVFNYKDSSLAPYVRVTGGLSSLGKSAFGDSSGSGTSVDGTTKFDYSGELGLMVALAPSLHVRAGAELLQHRPVSNAAGTDAAGTELFRLDSSVSAFVPNVTLEYVYSAAGSLRYYGLVGAGLADVTVENKYAMSSAGTTALGVSDFTEKLSGKATETHIGVGLETLFTDNVTFNFDVGYRILQIKSLKYKSDVKNIVSPSGASQGADALNGDGGQRSLNLGGVVVGLSFRFYLNFL